MWLWWQSVQYLCNELEDDVDDNIQLFAEADESRCFLRVSRPAARAAAAATVLCLRTEKQTRVSTTLPC
jgi:hypothetical protein